MDNTTNAAARSVMDGPSVKMSLMACLPPAHGPAVGLAPVSQDLFESEKVPAPLIHQLQGAAPAPGYAGEGILGDHHR